MNLKNKTKTKEERTQKKKDCLKIKSEVYNRIMKKNNKNKSIDSSSLVLNQKNNPCSKYRKMASSTSENFYQKNSKRIAQEKYEAIINSKTVDDNRKLTKEKNRQKKEAKPGIGKKENATCNINKLKEVPKKNGKLGPIAKKNNKYIQKNNSENDINKAENINNKNTNSIRIEAEDKMKKSSLALKQNEELYENNHQFKRIDIISINKSIEKRPFSFEDSKSYILNGDRIEKFCNSQTYNGKRRYYLERQSPESDISSRLKENLIRKIKDKENSGIYKSSKINLSNSKKDEIIRDLLTKIIQNLNQKQKYFRSSNKNLKTYLKIWNYHTNEEKIFNKKKNISKKDKNILLRSVIYFDNEPEKFKTFSPSDILVFKSYNNSSSLSLLKTFYRANNMTVTKPISIQIFQSVKKDRYDDNIENINYSTEKKEISKETKCRKDLSEPSEILTNTDVKILKEKSNDYNNSTFLKSKEDLVEQKGQKEDKDQEINQNEKVNLTENYKENKDIISTNKSINLTESILTEQIQVLKGNDKNVNENDSKNKKEDLLNESKNLSEKNTKNEIQELTKSIDNKNENLMNIQQNIKVNYIKKDIQIFTNNKEKENIIQNSTEIGKKDEPVVTINEAQIKNESNINNEIIKADKTEKVNEIIKESQNENSVNPQEKPKENNINNEKQIISDLDVTKKEENRKENSKTDYSLNITNEKNDINKKTDAQAIISNENEEKIEKKNYINSPQTQISESKKNNNNKNQILPGLPEKINEDFNDNKNKNHLIPSNPLLQDKSEEIIKSENQNLLGIETKINDNFNENKIDYSSCIPNINKEDPAIIENRKNEEKKRKNSSNIQKNIIENDTSKESQVIIEKVKAIREYNKNEYSRKMVEIPEEKKIIREDIISKDKVEEDINKRLIFNLLNISNNQDKNSNKDENEKLVNSINKEREEFKDNKLEYSTDPPQKLKDNIKKNNEQNKDEEKIYINTLGGTSENSLKNEKEIVSDNSKKIRENNKEKENSSSINTQEKNIEKNFTILIQNNINKMNEKNIINEEKVDKIYEENKNENSYDLPLIMIENNKSVNEEAQEISEKIRENNKENKNTPSKNKENNISDDKVKEDENDNYFLINKPQNPTEGNITKEKQGIDEEDEKEKGKNNKDIINKNDKNKKLIKQNQLQINKLNKFKRLPIIEQKVKENYIEKKDDNLSTIHKQNENNIENGIELLPVSDKKVSEDYENFINVPQKTTKTNIKIENNILPYTRDKVSQDFIDNKNENSIRKIKNQNRISIKNKIHHLPCVNNKVKTNNNQKEIPTNIPRKSIVNSINNGIQILLKVIYKKQEKNKFDFFKEMKNICQNMKCNQWTFPVENFNFSGNINETIKTSFYKSYNESENQTIFNDLNKDNNTPAFRNNDNQEKEDSKQIKIDKNEFGNNNNKDKISNLSETNDKDKKSQNNLFEEMWTVKAGDWKFNEKSSDKETLYHIEDIYAIYPYHYNNKDDLGNNKGIENSFIDNRIKSSQSNEKLILKTKNNSDNKMVDNLKKNNQQNNNNINEQNNINNVDSVLEDVQQLIEDQPIKNSFFGNGEEDKTIQQGSYHCNNSNRTLTIKKEKKGNNEKENDFFFVPNEGRSSDVKKYL